MLDKYFKSPILYDYLFSGSVAFSLIVLYIAKKIYLPIVDRSLSITSDLCNVGLTLAGFILTLLTVLITFKSSSKVTKQNYSEETPVFEIFFASDLYLKTVRLLKNCIKSLVFISVVGYGLKICLSAKVLEYLFFFNIFGLIIIGLTIWRCLLILSKILKLQEQQ